MFGKLEEEKSGVNVLRKDYCNNRRS